MHLLLAFIATASIALSLETAVCHAVRHAIITTQASRKLLHVGMGPVFMMCWPWFSSADGMKDGMREWAAPIVASLIPLLITLKFVLVAVGVLHDPLTVSSMARTGAC